MACKPERAAYPLSGIGKKLSTPLARLFTTPAELVYQP